MSENIDNERGKTFTAQKPMTNPTADAAKLLPCPFCGSAPVVYRHPAVASLWSIQCTSRDCDVRPSSPYLETVEATAAKWNTRPQPAPPEGEPDLKGDLDIIRAARPKVEDAGVAKIANDLREAGKVLDNGVTKILDAGFFVKAADLLERLAGDVQNWWSAAIVAMKAQEAAEAKLAEREAELAKADAVLAECYFNDASGLTDAVYAQTQDKARKRHAARQQQKDSAESSSS